MTGKHIIFFSILLIFASGCGIRAREEALEKKEAAFAEREKQLQFKEKALLLQEQEILAWKQQMDSSRQDTTNIYDSTITGIWNVKMTCIETSCAGSAIGDIKSETWEFSYQDKNIMVKAMAGDKLQRIYSGNSDGRKIKLKEYVADPAVAPTTKILVDLNTTGTGGLEGLREIIRENDCSIVYRMQLNKQ